MASEQEEFLKELEGKNENIFDKPETEESPEQEESEAERESKVKNRAYRRLEEKYQREREAGIAMAERIKTLSEVQKFQEEVGDDPYKEIPLIFGTNTPESQKATDILLRNIKAAEERGTKRALEQFEEVRGSEGRAIQEEEKNLDAIMEGVEDDYGIDMSDSTERRAYLTLLEKVSPKDSDGNIIEYADPDATAELYLARKKSSNNNSRAKELSSRSMTQSGSSQPSRLAQTAEEKYLKENDLMF